MTPTRGRSSGGRGKTDSGSGWRSRGAKAPGIDLRAPITTPDERPIWHWDLVRMVQPGDVILHWFTTPAGATGIVEWSRAAAAPVVQSHVWVPRTRPDLDAATADRRPHWVVPLEDYTPLPRPITREQVECIHAEVVRLEDQLKERYRGFKYYPFQDYRPTELRARQAYLTKMPVGLLSLLNRLGRFGFEIEYEAHRPARRGPQR